MPNSAITSTYEDTRMLIFQISHRMSSTYYLPFEEVLGQAHAIFVDAFYSYDASFNTKFTTWLQNKLQWGLTTWLQKEYRSRLHVELNEEVVGSRTSHPHVMKDLLAEMTDEARIVMSSPDELIAIMEWGKIEGQKQIRQTIREYIVDRLGWAADEINRGFHEIGAVLADRPLRNRTEEDLCYRLCGLSRGRVWYLTKKYREA